MMRRWLGVVLLTGLLSPWLLTLGWMHDTTEKPVTGSQENRESGQEKRDSSSSVRRICIERDGTGTYLNLEDYLPGVVACQIPEGKEESYSPEIWKCQAVLARTYLYRMMNGRNEILESELDLDYPGEFRSIVPGDQERAVKRLELAQAAVRDTAGEVLCYDGACILPLFHEESAGRTRQGDAQFPYLQAVESDRESSEGQALEFSWTVKEFFRRIGQIPGAPTAESGQLPVRIQTISRDSSGYLLQLQIGVETYTGDEICTALDLPSPCFSLEADDNEVRAVVRGRGHGYGLSQNGADQMAKEGWNYEDILCYYFKNIELISE